MCYVHKKGRTRAPFDHFQIPGLPDIDQLNRLVTLAEEIKSDRISERVLADLLARSEAEFQYATEVAEAFDAFAKRYPASCTWPLTVLNDISRIVHATPGEVFSLRNKRLLDAYSLDLLKSAIDEIEHLHADRTRLNSDFVLHGLPPAATIFEHLTHLKTANHFSFVFSSKYRAARRFFISISKGQKYGRDVAVAGLTTLGEWTARKDKFASNEPLINLLGKHFDGLDSDLACLRAIYNFYRDLSQCLSPTSHSDQIDLIHSADHHELRLLPATVRSDTASQFSTIREATDCISKLSAYLPLLREKVVEIDRLCNGLKGRDNVSIRTLKEICGHLPGLTQVFHNLNNHGNARTVFGELFCGATTHRKFGVQENISIARQLGDLTAEVWNAVVTSLQQETFARLTELLESSLRAEADASASLAALEKKTGLKFGDAGLEADWSTTERALRCAAEDRHGLFAHSHLYTLVASLQKHPLNDIIAQLLTEAAGLTSLGVVSEALFARSLARDVYTEYGPILTKRTVADLQALRKERIFAHQQ